MCNTDPYLFQCEYNTANRYTLVEKEVEEEVHETQSLLSLLIHLHIPASKIKRIKNKNKKEGQHLTNPSLRKKNKKSS